MRVNVNKSYNSAYRLLKGTKNAKTRKIPLPEVVIALFNEIKAEHLHCGGNLDDRIFGWQHNACNVMILTKIYMRWNSPAGEYSSTDLIPLNLRETYLFIFGGIHW